MFGVWQLALNNGTAILELILNSNGTYQYTLRVLTSTVTADQLVEQGSFTINDTTLSFTPTERSCNDALTPTTDGYAFDEDVLVLGLPTGNATFTRASSPLSSEGLTLVVGCGTPFAPVAMQGHAPTPANPGDSPTPFGTWLTTDANGISVQIILNEDYSYRISILIPTSTVTANEYIQTGAFLLSGTLIVFVPSKASCPVKTPAFANGYVFNRVALVTQDNTGKVTGLLRTAPSSLGEGLTLVIGCSINNGPWMPSPLAAVPK